MTGIATITQSEWRNKHRDFKGGTMKKEPRILRFVEGIGTCLIPVIVVKDGTGEQITKEVWSA